MERVITTQTGMIRYEATEYQRKVAEANAHAYMAAHKPKHSTKPEKSEKTASATPKPKSKGKEVAQETQSAKKLPRYVAIDTVKDKRAAPGTKKVVMIWDTQSEALVEQQRLRRAERSRRRHHRQVGHLFRAIRWQRTVILPATGQETS